MNTFFFFLTQVPTTPGLLRSRFDLLPRQHFKCVPQNYCAFRRRYRVQIVQEESRIRPFLKNDGPQFPLGLCTGTADANHFFASLEHDWISVRFAGYDWWKRLRQHAAVQRNVHQVDASQYVYASCTVFIHALGFRSTSNN